MVGLLLKRGAVVRGEDQKVMRRIALDCGHSTVEAFVQEVRGGAT